MSAGIVFLLTALAAPASDLRPASPRPSTDAIIAGWIRQSSPPKPRVNVSLDAESPYDRGDFARVFLMSEVDAYVTVVRIDTDGRIRLLFPIDPWEDNWVRGGRRVEVLSRGQEPAFRVSDYPGVGYVFAVASPDPFDFGGITRGDHWDYRAVADEGRVSGDPYVAISDLAERIAPAGEYDYDVAEYYVEQHYDYPRFTCYDCHSYTHWTAWNPYATYCSTFRIVIYDDWYYYPYRYYPYYPAYYPYYRPYPGPGPYYYRPYNPGPRYVFKDRGPGDTYVSRVDYREREDQVGRRPDRSGRDVGGRGSVPAPRGERQRGMTPDPGAAPGQATPRRPAPRRTETPRLESPPRESAPLRPGATGRRQPSGLRDAPESRGGAPSADRSRGQAPPSSGARGETGWGRRPGQGDRSATRPPAGDGPTREARGARQGEQPPRAAPPSSSRGGSPSASGRAPARTSGGSPSRGGQPELRRRQP